MSSIQYMEWFVKHEEHCLLNHTDSPQAMENSAIMNLYERSLKKWSSL